MSEKIEQLLDKAAEATIVQVHKGMRFNQGKLRYDLIPAYAMEQVAKVFTFGAIKYDDDNWRRGMTWKSVIASMKRHTALIEAGEDYDSESHVYHAAHVAVNSLFLIEFYKIYPEGDNRTVGFVEQKKIGLDIDEVVCDFIGAYSKHYNISAKNLYWNFTYKIVDHLEELRENKDFWMNIPKLREVPFEPVVYAVSYTHLTLPTN